MLAGAAYRRFRGSECRETDCPPGDREGSLYRVIVGRSFGRVMPLAVPDRNGMFNRAGYPFPRFRDCPVLP